MIKEHAKFSLRRKGGSVYHSYCKDCARGAMVEWHYSISPEEYAEMVGRQENRCAICGVDGGSDRATRLHVDHDHKTGVVRGLLCPPCNKGIGHLQDDVSIMLSAISYLGGVSSISRG